MGIGFDLSREYLDYLWHNFNVIKVDEGRLPFITVLEESINTANNVKDELWYQRNY